MTQYTRLLLPDVCRVADVSAALGVGEATARGLFRRGVIPGKRIAGRWATPRETFLAALRPEMIRCGDCAASVPAATARPGGSDLLICAACADRLRAARKPRR
jgi:hypothetical protein